MFDFSFLEPSRGFHSEHQAAPESGRPGADPARVRVWRGSPPEEQHRVRDGEASQARVIRCHKLAGTIREKEKEMGECTKH